MAVWHTFNANMLFLHPVLYGAATNRLMKAKTGCFSSCK